MIWIMIGFFYLLVTFVVITFFCLDEDGFLSLMATGILWPLIFVAALIYLLWVKIAHGFKKFLTHA